MNELTRTLACSVSLFALLASGTAHADAERNQLAEGVYEEQIAKPLRQHLKANQLWELGETEDGVAAG